MVLFKYCTHLTCSYSMTGAIGALSPCGKDWVSHGQSCYRMMTSKVDFAAANAICKSLGAYLVNIQSIEESRFVYNQASWSVRVWISNSSRTHGFQHLNCPYVEGQIPGVSRGACKDKNMFMCEKGKQSFVELVQTKPFFLVNIFMEDWPVVWS